MKKFLVPCLLLILFLIASLVAIFVINNEAYYIFYESKKSNIFQILSLEEENDSNESNAVQIEDEKVRILKDVGEAYMDGFGLSEEDFQIMKDLGIDVIEGNFDICATDEDVKSLLDLCNKYDIKIIMPAGSGEAEWGYECDMEPYPEDQKPVWNAEDVEEWINKWKDNSAIYAWDISNEAGSVFPNPSDENMLTEAELRRAYSDVKSVDSIHPVMIRMNGWFFYDYDENFFRSGNPFGENIADIVMINAYSNVDEYFDDFVDVVTSRAVESIKAIDSDVSIMVSLGVWEEEPLWFKPSVEILQKEISILENRTDIIGIAFFKYGAENSEWYLPVDASELLATISKK